MLSGSRLACLRSIVEALLSTIPLTVVDTVPIGDDIQRTLARQRNLQNLSKAGSPQQVSSTTVVHSGTQWTLLN
jgi:hypothetical protein